MRHLHTVFVAVVLFLIILAPAPACAPKPTAIGVPPNVTEPPTEVFTEATEEATAEATEAPAVESVEPQFPDFDPANFDNNSTVIDNKWMPMKPGTFWAYEGTALDGSETVDRRIEFTVTDLTKEIDGVRTVVAWIEDYNNGELIEKEVAFYAQDKDGNVWYFGEHPEDYEAGKFVEAPTWIAGIADSKPGIKMLTDPQLGAPVLYQGWGPEVEWSDYGQI